MRPNSKTTQEPVFNKETISELYNRKRGEAASALAKLFDGHVPKLGTLNGWVFEQTIQYCLRKELESLGVRAELREQLSLVGRAKADLGVGNLAIEIKSKGLFSKDDAERYSRFKEAAEKKGLQYLFFTASESYPKYRLDIVAALGDKNVFFLDTPGDWGRFVARIAAELTRTR